jgi:hypothetical protein
MVLIGVVAYNYFKQYVPKYRWNENYVIDNDQPYGLKFIYNILSSPRSKQDFVLLKKPPKVAINDVDTNSLYIFIGYNFQLDSQSSRKLMNFVKRGNNVFISSIESTHNIFNYLTQNKRPFIRYYNVFDSLIKVSFDSSGINNYTFDHKVAKGRVKYGWHGCDSIYMADTLSYFGFNNVSRLNGYYVDCFKIKYGKGWFVFHFNPILLTNYTLAGKDGYSYFSNLINPYIKKKIYWDEFSKVSAGSDGNDITESPLRFILSDKNLRWTWYLMWLLVLVFIIVNSKRKQAIIPIVAANRNTTIEYMNSVSKLHYNSRSLVYLADTILKHLLIFIKQRYDISPELKKHEIAKLLAPKSGISEETLNKMFRHHMGVKYSPVREPKELIEFYKLTEYFYKNCK